MGCSFKRALVLCFLVLAPALVARGQTSPRRPRGISAVVNIAENINQQQKANPSADLNAYFNNLYQDLLGNPAISGLTLPGALGHSKPESSGRLQSLRLEFCGRRLQPGFAWNAQNLAQSPKTIQLIVSAAFQSPQWLRDQIPSCEGLFQSPVQTPPSTCGKVMGYGTVLAQSKSRRASPIGSKLRRLT